MSFQISQEVRDKSIRLRQLARRTPNEYIGKLGSRAKAVLIRDHIADVEIRDGRWRLLSDERVGGNDIAPLPIEYMMAGVALCEGAQLVYNSIETGITFDSAEVFANSHMKRGPWVGLVPNKGFDFVDIEIKMVSKEKLEKIIELAKLSEARCPAYNSLIHPVKTNTKVFVNGTLAEQHSSSNAPLAENSS